MADEPTNEDPAPEPENDPTPDPKPEPAQEPDWKSEARKWEQRAKANKEAADKLKELEDAQKTEQERLTERLTESERRAAEAELKAARLEVATDKGLPRESVKFLTGTTPEELAASADELMALLKPADDDEPRRRPTERLRPGASPSTEPFNAEEIADSILSSPY